jgi:hypothetical protein
MTAPAPVIAQPDLEAHVWSLLGGLAGVNSFAYASAQLWPGWVYAWFIQVDARSARREAARATAEQARQIMASLPDQPWPGGDVCYCQPVEGPAWLPDEDGQPRYMARYEVRVHPRRDSGAVQPGPPPGVPPAARRHR